MTGVNSGRWSVYRYMLAALHLGLLCASTIGQTQPLPHESPVIRLYDRVGLDGFKRRTLTVVVGDSSRPETASSFQLTAWDGECSMRVDLSASDESISVSRWVAMRNDQPMTRLTTAACDHELYIRDDGNFEWNIVLKEPPDTNVFVWALSARGLRFIYQPPLTIAEIADGCRRPDSVVGSYAVYHAGRRGNVRHPDGSGSVYGTGKAFHIYRPKVIDASGGWTWGELIVDTVRSVLRLTVARPFLEAAAYPVTIDPTFGKTDVGASTKSLTARIRGSRFTIPAAGTADSITIYVTNDCDIGGCVYADNAGPAGLVDSSTTTVSSGGAGWQSLPSALTPTYTADTDYWIMGVDAGGDPIMAYDAGVGRGSYCSDVWPPSDPANSCLGSDRIYSAYVTYHTGEAESTTSCRRRRLILGDR